MVKMYEMCIDDIYGYNNIVMWGTIKYRVEIIDNEIDILENSINIFIILIKIIE